MVHDLPGWREDAGVRMHDERTEITVRVSARLTALMMPPVLPMIVGQLTNPHVKLSRLTVLLSALSGED
jgi:hypothetical protein